MILKTVARRPRLIGAERRLAAGALVFAILVFLISNLNGFAMMVAGAVGVVIALSVTAKNEDLLYEVGAVNKYKKRRSCIGERGSWYG